MSDPNEIVGHKTFDTGELSAETGLPKLRHEPLTRAEADALWAAAEAAKKARTDAMPTEQDAVRVMCSAYQRLRELGWRDSMYCPKNGAHFKAIEPGSSGIHDCMYMGEWPKGGYWNPVNGDLWPMRPCLIKEEPSPAAAHEDSPTKEK